MINENILAENITAIERVALARHPRRYYTKDLIENLCTDFLELKGDRRFADDPAIIGGTTLFRDLPVVIMGHQKGRDVNERRYRNFGMAKPEGYRKALRLMKLAEKFNRPVITFIDTTGAYPGVDAEERGQSEAIAYNLVQAAKLKVPLISVVVGEGGSGGALAIGVCDTLLMLENAVYSVISPEGCAAILWKSRDEAPQAAERLKLTAGDLKKLGVVDEVILEPEGGAVLDNVDFFNVISETIYSNLLKILSLSDAERERKRYLRLRSMGKWVGVS